MGMGGGVGKGPEIQASLCAGRLAGGDKWPQKRFLVKHPRWEPSALYTPTPRNPVPPLFTEPVRFDSLPV